MNLLLITRTLLVTFALFSGAIIVCSNSFILINKSSYDIFCRDRSVAQAKANTPTSANQSEIIIKSGERLQLSRNNRYSIRTAGTTASVSQYYDVPTPMDLAKQTLNREDEIMFSSLMWEEGFLPIISVYSGLLYGWKFTLSHTWTNKQNKKTEDQNEQWNKKWTNIDRE